MLACLAPFILYASVGGKEYEHFYTGSVALTPYCCRSDSDTRRSLRDIGGSVRQISDPVRCFIILLLKHSMSVCACAHIFFDVFVEFNHQMMEEKHLDTADSSNIVTLPTHISVVASFCIV